MKQAKAGGEIGQNGEFYQGGQFLPNTDLPKRGSEAKKPAGRKVEYEPYTWAVAPEGKHPILSAVGIALRWAEWQKTVEVNPNPRALAAYGYTVESAQALADKWNAGERWIDLG